jgi:hypothetical protein
MTTARRGGYERFLRNVQAPDELIMQNLIMDSPFRDTVTGDNQHLVVWPGGSGSPATLTSADLPTIELSDKLFARKFDHSIDRLVLRRLAARIDAPVPALEVGDALAEGDSVRQLSCGARRSQQGVVVLPSTTMTQ